MPLVLLLIVSAAAVYFWLKGRVQTSPPGAVPKVFSWMVRVGLFLAIGIALFVLILAPLPNKHRLLALVPAFFIGSVVYRTLGASKKRVLQKEPDLDRMKRIPRRD